MVFEHHADDAAGQLLEECQVRGGEVPERAELDHRFHVSFVQHRQHDDVARACVEQSTAHLDGLGRDIRQQQALPVGGRLADQPFADAVAARLAILEGLIGVAGELLEARHVVRCCP